jgi:tetratricopeptide (TPR) repeat protein
MNKRRFITGLICGLIVSLAALQPVEGKKNLIIPNAALVITSKPPVEKPAAKKPAPEVVKQKPDDPPAPKVVKPETVFLYENIAAVDYFNLGISLRNEGMYEQAIEAFNQVLLITPGYGDAHYNIALTYFMLGNGNAAFEEYQILKNIDAKAAEGLYNEIKDNAMSDMDNKFIMQVGAFRNNAYAEEMIAKLKAKYFHAYIEKTDRFNKVKIGGIKSKEEGRRMMLDIGKEFNIKPYLVKLK